MPFGVPESRAEMTAVRVVIPLMSRTVRIDSRFLLPAREWLPHVNCYPAAKELRDGGEDAEAAEYGDTARA
jgi:hypothetical protein